MEKYSNNIIGYIHIFLSIIKCIYGYIFPSIILFDVLYLIIFACVPLLWIFCKGECLISYFYKISENNDYKLGDDPFNHKDVSVLFPNKTHYLLYSNISIFVYIGSLLIVNYRTNIIPSYIMYLTLLLLLLYVYDMDFFKSYYSSLFFPYFQIILTIPLVIIIIKCIQHLFIVYKN